jgi:hypothetical protein
MFCLNILHACKYNIGLKLPVSKYGIPYTHIKQMFDPLSYGVDHVHFYVPFTDYVATFS